MLLVQWHKHEEEEFIHQMLRIVVLVKLVAERNKDPTIKTILVKETCLIRLMSSMHRCIVFLVVAQLSVSNL